MEEHNLINFENYGIYSDFINGNPKFCVDVSTIDITNWEAHFSSILNIFRDGIETEFVQKTPINLKFSNFDTVVQLYLADYLINLILWRQFIMAHGTVMSYHLFFEEKGVTRKSIKNYIDNFFIKPYRRVLDIITLNNIINDMFYPFKFIDEFAFYLLDTVDLYDDIALAKAVPRFRELLNVDMSNVPLEDVKDYGLTLTKEAISIILNAKQFIGRDHCMANSFRSGEGVNERQYKEVNINIGTKPNGEKGIYGTAINRSFINGGVRDPIDYGIDSSIGRIAQILQKRNVGDSGSFARVLSLNNIDTDLHPDPNYVCDTVNYEIVEIKNHKILHMLTDMHYRLDPKGIQLTISDDDTHLIGQMIYLHSPMTCASKHGKGICHRCYGNLARLMANVNIGKLASDNLSAVLTQILLSAKHLLEAFVRKILWMENFYEFFEVEYNYIKLSPNIELKDLKLVIDPDKIVSVDDDVTSSDEDDVSTSYNEYITEFDIVNEKTGMVWKMGSADGLTKLFVARDLASILRTTSDIVEVSLFDIDNIPLFFINIMGTEITEKLDKLLSILDKKSITTSIDRNTFLQSFLETIIECGLDDKIMGKDCTVLLSNQIRSNTDILELPNWMTPNPGYQLVTLSDALMFNPSVSISMQYESLAKQLYSPITFRKRKASKMDLVMMEQPQNFLTKTDDIIEAKEQEKKTKVVMARLPEELDFNSSV